MTRNIAKSNTKTPKDSWETPQKLFDVLHAEIGFTVDAAGAPENAKLERYWSKEDDALEKDWQKEKVFVNPPFSQLSKDLRWVQKMREAEVCVALLPAAVDTKWFHCLVEPRDGASLFFFKGRVKYEIAGESAGSPTFPTILYTNRVAWKFWLYEKLEEAGYIMRRVDL